MSILIVLGDPSCPDSDEERTSRNSLKESFLQGIQIPGYCGVDYHNVFDIANGKRCQNTFAPKGDYRHVCRFGARYLNNKILACGGYNCRKYCKQS